MSDGVDDASGGSPEISRIVAGHYGNPFDGIGAEVETKHAPGSRVCIVGDADPVQNVVVLLWPTARDTDLGTKSTLASTGVAVGCILLRLDRTNACLKSRGLGPIAAI